MGKTTLKEFIENENGVIEKHIQEQLKMLKLTETQNLTKKELEKLFGKYVKDQISTPVLEEVVGLILCRNQLGLNLFPFEGLNIPGLEGLTGSYINQVAFPAPY